MLDISQDGFEDKSFRVSIDGTNFDLVLHYSDVALQESSAQVQDFDFSNSLDEIKRLQKTAQLSKSGDSKSRDSI